MYKVLIVDDETIIRKGLKNIVDWQGVGCVVCAEASDGIEGLEMIKVHLPHIIIVDIRMPGMDGIEMISNAKKIVPASKMIILSGYRDFEYVQGAIKLGAFDYILKPSKIEDITSVINRAKESLQDEQRKALQVKELKKNAEESLEILRQKLLYDLLLNINLDREGINNEINLCKLNIESFRVVVVHILKNQDSSFQGRDYEGIINFFKEICGVEYSIRPVALSSERLVFIVEDSKKGIPKDDINEKINMYKDYVNQYYNFSIFTGISDYGSSIFELKERMQEAIKKLKVSYGDMVNFPEDNIEKKSVKNIKEGYMSLTIKKALDYINDNYCRDISLNEVAQYTNVTSYYLSRLFAKETGKNFVDYLIEIRIQKAKKLIKEDNYKTYEIAEMVGIKDPHYFSKLFKRYTGVTPTEYRDKDIV